VSTLTIILIIITGFAAGVLGSMVGIGGGIVVVPALIAMSAMIPGMNPKMATGTSLAMLLPPIGILGVVQYYKHGQVNLYVAALLCAGFVFGGWLGGRIAMNIDKDMLKKAFAVFLLLVSLKFLFIDKPSKPAASANNVNTTNPGRMP
jgi:uncharacterized membrane protein YfcA